jgi:hypothetical protein
VILPDEHLDTCGKWFRLVVASALHDLWRGGRGECRVLAILDEFAHIGHLEILEKAAGMAAGHGLQIWPVLQNLTQLKKDYGENWETFIAGSEIRQFFATRDQTSAKYVSETSGQRTVTTAGQSIQNASVFNQSAGGTSDSSGQAGQPLIRPHEISGFGPNESLIFGPRNIVIDALRQPYFHTPELRGRYSPDPQHKSDAAPPPPLNPESITTFGDTLAATEAAARKKPSAWHGVFGMLQGKLGWALFALAGFVAYNAYFYWNTRHLREPGAITRMLNQAVKDMTVVAQGNQETGGREGAGRTGSVLNSDVRTQGVHPTASANPATALQSPALQKGASPGAQPLGSELGNSIFQRLKNDPHGEIARQTGGVINREEPTNDDPLPELSRSLGHRVMVSGSPQFIALTDSDIERARHGAHKRITNLPDSIPATYHVSAVLKDPKGNPHSPGNFITTGDGIGYLLVRVEEDGRTGYMKIADFDKGTVPFASHGSDQGSDNPIPPQ